MNLERAFWNATNFLMTIFFAAGVGVQYGNPISVLGMLIYGAAGVTCVMAIRGTEVRLLPTIIGMIALIWALTLAPQVIGKVHFDKILYISDMPSMESHLLDVARQMVGLLIVAGWMAVLMVVSLRYRVVKARTRNEDLHDFGQD